MMAKLSAHFSTKEMGCRCCGKVEINPRLLDALEELRRRIGRGIRVTSGYRCPKNNRRVGGKPKSQHRLGNAADLQVRGLTVTRLWANAAQIRAFQTGGIGVYKRKRFVHVDVRPNGPARWIG